ncbi:putative bifunctional diguanylate cyclase/phosphodiesterase [Deinococcus aquaedulcis]|uniref:putative bifunctional diguanylate cyclase/phosphodiesterase n=1 Tax=Deinococcus aquaedulcis TaxID=2840455 RepID=UPI001C83207F|nr:EAL domain-containing protein [Deinococcus aquaedulcis]
MPPRRFALLSFLWSGGWSAVWLAALFTALYLGLQATSLHFQGVPGLSAWYLPAGLILAFLTICGLRFAPWVLVTVTLGGLLLSPHPPDTVAALITVGAYVVGAALLRRSAGWRTGLVGLRDVARFATAALLASGLAALGTVSSLKLAGHLPALPWSTAILNWWVGDLVGIMALTPPLLLLRRARAGAGASDGPMQGARAAVLGLQLLAIPATLLLVFGLAAAHDLQVLYLCFLPLLWLALHQGLPLATFGNLLMSVGITLMAWATSAPVKQRLDMQLLMTTLALTTLVLATLSTERRRQRQRLAHLALHDALTGLPNRRAFLDRLGEWLHAQQTGGGAVLVLFLDIDRLKWVNDTLGHAAGDTYLQVMAERLRACLPPQGLAARLGGDEFALALPVQTQAEETEWAQRVLAGVQGPLQVAGYEITPAVSMGASSAPRDGTEVAAVLQRADEAMYHAKRTGQGLHHFVSAAPAGQYTALQYEHDLRQALLQGGQLELHYQPQFELPSMTISGFEALVRWRHPEQGLIPPGAFLPVAERTGLIVPLGRWVMREACAQLQRWSAQSGRPLRMAVNVSAAQLHPPLVDEVRAVLGSSDLAPGQLELELTESTLLVDPIRAARVLAEIGELGVRMALDDFGTGYSSLSHLNVFPVNTLKIDRSFVQALQGCPPDRSVVRGVVALGHALGISVLAEGAETPQQVEWVSALGCDAVQGYAVGRPVPPAQAAAFLNGAVGEPR